MEKLGKVSILGDSQARRLRDTLLHNNPTTVRNKDIVKGGLTTAELKVLVRRQHNKLYQCVFIFISINDILKNIPTSVIKSNILSIVKILTMNNKSVIITTVPPVLNMSDTVRNNIITINIFITSLQTQQTTTVIKYNELFPPFAIYRKEFYQQQYPDGRRDNIHLSRLALDELINLISATMN